MSLTLDDGSVRISVTYSLKVPTAVQYAPEQASESMSIEWPVKGDVETVMAQAREIENMIFRDLQLTVFAHLGIENFTELPNGRLVPTINQFTYPEAKKSWPKKSGGGGGGYTKRENTFTPDPERLHNIILQGETVTVEDLRPLKEAGKFSAKSPDFQVGDRAVWIEARNGGKNPEALAIISAIDDQLPFVSPGETSTDATSEDIW
jgi:hypothetical protein